MTDKSGRNGSEDEKPTRELVKVGAVECSDVGKVRPGLETMVTLLAAQGRSPMWICKDLQISRSVVMRILAKQAVQAEIAAIQSGLRAQVAGKALALCTEAMGALQQVLRDKDAPADLRARTALKYLELHARSGQPTVDASTHVSVGTDAAAIIRALAQRPTQELKDEELRVLSDETVVDAVLDEKRAMKDGGEQ